MNVLSLFDGMSGGQIALTELGIKPNIYYASEIDKHAIAQTQLNFPNTIQLGSVVDVDVSKLERIDLLLGGSPCQSFSFAGKRKGMATKCDIEVYTLEKYLQLKSDGFEFEGQSYLFWEYMRILTDIRKSNPEVKFLLENVEMGAKWERILSEAIGIYGVHINSNLVSAQNRRRIFWTNIKTREDGFFGELHSDIPQPADRGILLRDILEREVDEKYYLRNEVVSKLVEHKKRHSENKNGFGAVFHGGDKKMAALKVGGRGVDDLVIQLNPSKESGGVQPYQQNRVYDPNGISPCLNTDSRPHAIFELNYRQQRNLKGENEKADTFLSTSLKGSQANGMTLILQRPRGFNKGGMFEEKSPAVTSNSFEQNNHVIGNSRIRRLTPTECARLQTFRSGIDGNAAIPSNIECSGTDGRLRSLNTYYLF